MLSKIIFAVVMAISCAIFVYCLVITESYIFIFPIVSLHVFGWFCFVSLTCDIGEYDDYES